jgi:predicted transposase/invertase (TIGR01784 family)
VFADPRTDVVIKKLFGTPEHRHLLIALLEALLGLEGEHRLARVELLSPEQRPQVKEIKYSIVDVKCVDARGTHYVAEMQVLNVEGFEKRIVSHVAKAYARQMGEGQRYPELDDVVGVTLCDFELWPRREGWEVPMLSRWRMQEQSGGGRGLGQLQFVFLELPKYDGTRPPETAVEKWAYFFREARKLKEVPEVLAEQPYREALEAARVARFTVVEWEAYLRECIAIQDKRGALALAERRGEQRGEQRGLQREKEEALRILRAVIRRILRQRGLTLEPREEARLERCGELGTLERWLAQALTAGSAVEALG